MKSAIAADNKKLSSENINTEPPCNSRIKNECSLNEKWKSKNILCKYVASTSIEPDKVYLGTIEGDFKQHFYNHEKSCNNSTSYNDTKLSKYVWKTKEKYSEIPILQWYIVRAVPSYLNLTKRCLLFFHQKLEILYYHNTDKQLNKRSYRLIAMQTNIYSVITNLTIEVITTNHWELPRDAIEDWLLWHLYEKYRVDYQNCLKCRLFSPISW